MSVREQPARAPTVDGPTRPTTPGHALRLVLLLIVCGCSIAASLWLWRAQRPETLLSTRREGGEGPHRTVRFLKVLRDPRPASISLRLSWSSYDFGSEQAIPRGPLDTPMDYEPPKERTAFHFYMKSERMMRCPWLHSCAGYYVCSHLPFWSALWPSRAESHHVLVVSLGARFFLIAGVGPPAAVAAVWAMRRRRHRRRPGFPVQLQSIRKSPAPGR